MTIISSFTSTSVFLSCTEPFPVSNVCVFVFSVACPAGLYGVSCSQTCVCHNNSSCDAVSGQCECNAGWTGDTCSQRKILTLHSLQCFIYMGHICFQSHRIVTTKTCHHCFGSDKHIILIFGGNKQNFGTVMQLFSIFSILVCELKFCNVKWLLLKHYCHYRKCAVTTKTCDDLSKIKYTELSTKML